jgi:hypothetical protein
MSGSGVSCLWGTVSYGEILGPKFMSIKASSIKLNSIKFLTVLGFELRAPFELHPQSFFFSFDIFQVGS